MKKHREGVFVLIMELRGRNKHRKRAFVLGMRRDKHRKRVFVLKWRYEGRNKHKTAGSVLLRSAPVFLDLSQRIRDLS